MTDHPTASSSAERKAARALAANKARISHTRTGTASAKTLERRRKRRARPSL